MPCKDCECTCIPKGFDRITCSICGRESFIPTGYADVCIDCSNQYFLCRICGKTVKRNRKDTWE